MQLKSLKGIQNAIGEPSAPPNNGWSCLRKLFREVVGGSCRTSIKYSTSILIAGGPFGTSNTTVIVSVYITQLHNHFVCFARSVANWGLHFRVFQK